MITPLRSARRLATVVLLTAGAMLPVEAAETPPNLVPKKHSTDPNYWCTWYAQNYWVQRGGEITNFKAINNSTAREQLNEHNLFNRKDGWVTNYLQRSSRGDFTFLIDHGWQDKNKKHRLPGTSQFFSLQMDFNDFPRYKNKNYAESLRLFNEDIKAEGWRDLGLWVRGDVTPDAAKRMVEWSKYAGITYWKIDGGGTSHFYSYNIKQKIYPQLKLEYICGANGPINPRWNNPHLKAYPSVYAPGGAKHKAAFRIMQNTDVFRTYDVAPLMFSITTMRRVSDILSQTQGQAKYIATLNIQDDPFVAAGLGCLVAAKRHPNYNERLLNGTDLHHQLAGKRRIQFRMNEIDRFSRWSRIAHAFPAGKGSFLRSKQELIGYITYSKRNTWYKPAHGKKVYQSAPAIMARNMPLPEVAPMEYPPHVMACTYPTGPTAIATEGRVTSEIPWSEPRAKVSVQIKDATQPIGIFAHYDSLTLKFSGSLTGVTHVWAQDLLADKATDIRSQVTITANTITIPGKLIDTLGTSAGDKGDISAPGLVLKLEGKNLPIADDSYYPIPKPITSITQVNDFKKQVDGFKGTAKITKKNGLYAVSAKPYKVGFVLKPLAKTIETNKTNITWTMQSASNKPTKNGFLVLSSGADAQNAIFAGAFIGSNKLSLFEQSSQWGSAAKSKPLNPAKKFNCKAVLDMDARTLTLTINGTTQSLTFSESVTTVDHIGFAVKGTQTQFSNLNVAPSK